ncbi:MAG: class I SAM-dependent methyltransferase [Dehalococcoidia bacterium]
MNRPQIGTNPVFNEMETDSYLDFVQGLFGLVSKLDSTARPLVEAERAAFREREGRDLRDVDEANEVLGRLPIVASRHRIRRTIQDMNHTAVHSDLVQREAELIAALDRADTMGPGSVQYDPNWVVPEYTTREIHRLRGGYVTDPLAGFYYHANTKQFYRGRNDRDEQHQDSIDKLPIPADGQVRRILDLGCSSGQSATALKKRFPQAEVWAIDIGIPMVRYAHLRALQMGLEVHFKQALAERTGFPDGSFDLVHAFILFHELPLDAADQVIAEAARVLRPGGLFCILDFPTQDTPQGQSRGIYGEILGDIDRRHNEEPYREDFTHCDFSAMLRRHFPKVDVLNQDGLPLRVATK